MRTEALLKGHHLQLKSNSDINCKAQAQHEASGGWNFAASMKATVTMHSLSKREKSLSKNSNKKSIKMIKTYSHATPL